ncbi:glycosyltransferase [Desulfuromonas sp. TF]|uniref:glycosyltransferase n=1 Tax=Desulfuromonas sp. TF TaxID=1232410 RepID=UPI00040BA406|nr:glycosyltransferase [Desulfuromonas sp. TF]
MRKDSFIIAITVAVITIVFWALINRPEAEPPWPSTIQGFSFAPYHAGQSAISRIYPSREQIDADLALLSGHTHAVRTYSVDGILGDIPPLARTHRINVALGAWLDEDRDRNAQEISSLLEVVSGARNVVRIIVGNEVLLRGNLSVAELADHLERVRSATDIPVSTAEPWHVWIDHPELVDHVDYIAVHMLPYWEGLSVERAVDYVVERMDELKGHFPDKRIVITEVGWPSNGRTIKEAVASESNQATFLRRFLARAAEEGYIYYVMEAFDQPWKRKTEGSVGAYWGVYDTRRQPKFTFEDPIVKVPEWPMLAAISVIAALITFALLLIDSRRLRKRGRSFLAVIAYVAATAVVWIVYDYSNQYLTLANIMVGVLLILGMIGVIIVLLAEAHEWAEALWLREHRRQFMPQEVADEMLPMVSIHVPAYNEPPDMMIETLDALAALDYPRYEVLVIDNNTKDPSVWKPVEAHCARLGSRFRFFHKSPLPGYKAGALNFAIQKTAAEAEIVAVIDSDYKVHPRWLRDLCPQFLNPEIAIVQAPQDYRDSQENAFKAMAYAEYRGFFYIGMIVRNERNAIIQHGTMTMVRRTALEQVNGWAEWCITEDAELGLRIFEAGLKASYIPQSYGRGLMPDTFIDYKKQRFRWAYGSVQIMRRHSRTLLFDTQGDLTIGQRYHFLAGWLPWLADGINVIFNLAALSWSAAMVLAPTKVAPPLLIFAVLPLVLFLFKVVKLIYLYETRVGAKGIQILAAAFAGLSLSHTIGIAVLTGLFKTGLPFFRTPKQASKQALVKALQAAREETLLLIGLCLASGAIIARIGVESLDLLVWCIMLLIQGIPYASTLAVSILSALPHLPAGSIGETGSMRNTAQTVVGPKARPHA